MNNTYIHRSLTLLQRREKFMRMTSFIPGQPLGGDSGSRGATTAAAAIRRLSSSSGYVGGRSAALTMAAGRGGSNQNTKRRSIVDFGARNIGR